MGKNRKKKKSSIISGMLKTGLFVLAVLLAALILSRFVLERVRVRNHSMEHTLEENDIVLIDKISYRFREPERFDIIVFPYEDDVYYIKRVIGLPGETVQILPDGTIIIDGKKLVESYGKEIITETGTAAEPRTLGEDEFFVLGDNRNDSRDSRWPDVGNIHKSKIIGKAVLRLSPFSKFGKIK